MLNDSSDDIYSIFCAIVKERTQSTLQKRVESWAWRIDCNLDKIRCQRSTEFLANFIVLTNTTVINLESRDSESDRMLWTRWRSERWSGNRLHLIRIFQFLLKDFVSWGSWFICLERTKEEEGRESDRSRVRVWVLVVPFWYQSHRDFDIWGSHSRVPGMEPCDRTSSQTRIQWESNRAE